MDCVDHQKFIAGIRKSKFSTGEGFTDLTHWMRTVMETIEPLVKDKNEFESREYSGANTLFEKWQPSDVSWKAHEKLQLHAFFQIGGRRLRFSF